MFQSIILRTSQSLPFINVHTTPNQIGNHTTSSDKCKSCKNFDVFTPPKKECSFRLRNLSPWECNGRSFRLQNLSPRECNGRYRQVWDPLKKKSMVSALPPLYVDHSRLLTPPVKAQYLERRETPKLSTRVRERKARACA